MTEGQRSKTVEELEIFDREFPYKEKQVTDTQLQ